MLFFWRTFKRTQGVPMEKNKTLPVTDARKKLYALIKACDDRARTFVITSDGRAVARLMGEQEYESLIETLEVLSDKKQVERLTKALKHAQAGKLYSHQDVFGRPQPKA